MNRPVETIGKKRDPRIDALKGVLILLVIFGHGLQYYVYKGNEGYWQDPVFTFIYIFHMPLFMAVSGYVAVYGLQGLKLRELVLKRCLRFLLPIMFWCAAIVIADCLLRRMPDPLQFMQNYHAAIFHYYWFLWALAISSILVWCALALQMRDALVLPVSAMLLLAMPFTSGILVMAQYTYPFFCAGYLYHRYEAKLVPGLWAYLCSALIAVTCYAVWRPQTYVYNNHLRMSTLPDVQMVAILFAGGAAFCVLVSGVLSYLWRLGPQGRIQGYCATLGKVTLELYLLQIFLFRLAWALPLPRMQSYAANLAMNGVLTAAIVALGVACIAATRRMGKLNLLIWGRT